MNQLVSVIIPVFNSGRFLSETLASVENQTYPSVEVVIVDNGSEEELTINLLKNLEKKYSVEYIGPLGVSAARNKGMELAKGEYILPLDSDDLIMPTFIEESVHFFTKNPNIKVVRTNIELFGIKNSKVKFEEFSFNKLLARNLMVVSSLFRKKDALAIGGFDSGFINGFEDWEFWINLLKDEGQVGTIEKHLFKYRIRKNSRNHSMKAEDLENARKLIWSKHKNLFAKYFVNPKETFEYKLVVDSKANKLGNLLLGPFSFFKLMK